MTAVPPRCCPGCAGPCRRRTGRTSRLVACIERRHTRPSACCAAVSVPFARLANLSLQSGKFPARYKTAQVLPLLKKAGLDS